jgi:hypothetical protein
MNKIYSESSSASGDFSVVFDDDGRVAYGYIIDRGKIAGDVWLYNVAEDPEAPEWRDRSKAPFLNPLSHARIRDFERPRNADDVTFVWYDSQADGGMAVDIMSQGVRLGRLRPGSKPGEARLATRDGPLAKILKP